MTLTVAMKGDHAITLAATSQPPQELEPVRGTRFRIKGQNNSLIDFRGDDLVQACGAYAARERKFGGLPAAALAAKI